jgi:methionine-rich copper-binding protein CopC
MLTHLRRTTSVLALGVIFLTAPFGFAHARPKVMVPAPDSTVSAPSHVSVTFSEDLVAQFSSLNVTDEMGGQVSREKSKADATNPKLLTVELPSALPAGAYLVHWVAAAVDGHRMEGEYKFTVK